MQARTMTTQTGDSWRFWGGWAIAFLGFPLGGLAGLGLAGGVTGVLPAVLGGAATGAVIGATQWLVLRQRLPLSHWWIAATSAGMSIGLALSVGLLGIATTGASLPLRGFVTGAGIGIAQYLVLRQHTPRALIWAIIVAGGWSLGWIVTRAVGVDLAPNFTVFGSTGAWTFQLLTGLTLAWLLRPNTNQPSVG